jgi:hypothetical protein
MRPWGSHRLRVGVIVGLVTLFAVVPMALSALPRLSQSDTLLYYTQSGTSLSAPFAVDKAWRPTIDQIGGFVTLQWPELRSIGGHMNYVVLRAPINATTQCDATGGGAQCRLLGTIVDFTNGKHAYQERPGKGVWQYRVGAKASWLNDATQGDIYVVGPPVAIKIP